MVITNNNIQVKLNFDHLYHSSGEKKTYKNIQIKIILLFNSRVIPLENVRKKQ
jgi:hypothetical protein